MPFSLRCETRHTDTYAGTGFVHAGVLLAFTELAYAAFERAAGVSKPAHVVAVQVRSRSDYLAPLPWQDGALVEVTTEAATARGFTQVFSIRSARSDRRIAHIEHDWVWLDTSTGRAVPLPEDVQAAFLAMNVISTPGDAGRSETGAPTSH